MGRVKIGKSGLKPSQETRLNGLKLIGLVGNEKYVVRQINRRDRGRSKEKRCDLFHVTRIKNKSREHLAATIF